MTLASKKTIITVLIIVITALILWAINTNPPKSQRGGGARTPLISVQVQTLALKKHQVMVESFGIVKPRVQSLLISQSSGQITYISENFSEGGFFKKGELLLKLDDRDHRASVKSAQANVLVAEQGLQEEQARSKQAAIDWQRLGNGEEANDLVLRQPQLAAAKAQLLSAQAQLEQSELDLERTKITAPYDGRVLTRNVDLGQVVSSNNQLAELYAIDRVDVRLPIKNKDLAFVDLPENFRDGAKNSQGANVNFRSDLIGEQHWKGTVVRTEGAIDDLAQQLYVVATINDPYKSSEDNQYPVKIGQYVTANIYGKTIENALVIPNSAIYQGSYVYVVEGAILKRQDIVLAWQNDQQAMVAKGLEVGQQLVLTTLGQVNSGTRVKILGAPETQVVNKEKGKRKERGHGQKRGKDQNQNQNQNQNKNEENQ
jgi:RND family efflux transporter MFP subunit